MMSGVHVVIWPLVYRADDLSAVRSSTPSRLSFAISDGMALCSQQIRFGRQARRFGKALGFFWQICSKSFSCSRDQLFAPLYPRKQTIAKPLSTLHRLHMISLLQTLRICLDQLSSGLSSYPNPSSFHALSSSATSLCAVLPSLNLLPSLIHHPGMSSAPEHNCNLCKDRWRTDMEYELESLPPPSERRLQLCSGCRRVWYCSSIHQKWDWLEHIFHCKPDKVTTAHYLIRSIKKDLLPDHPQTLADYGFTRARDNIEQNYLFGLYAGLVKYIPMQRIDGTYLNPKKLHQWRLKGVLVAEIKKAFEALPPSSRGGYYPWFLENQHIVDPTVPPPAGTDIEAEQIAAATDARRRAWIYSGGSSGLTNAEIEQQFKTLRELDHPRFNCATFIGILYMGLHPSPHDSLWVPFGFCACTDLGGEISLARSYMTLIASCTFDDFLKAFLTGSIAELMSRSNLKPLWGSEAEAFGDTMKGTPNMSKSVWRLKAFLMAHLENPAEMARSAQWDYGFFNCRTEVEAKTLRLAYERYFGHRDCRPLDLHAACIQGRIYEHVDSVVRLKDKNLRRLMKNAYPLPEPPE